MFKIFKNQDSIGLGLSICKEISQKYEGDITFLSEYKQGSKFKLTFSLEEFERNGIQMTLDNATILQQSTAFNTLNGWNGSTPRR